jgi:hypothetical protein
MQAKPGDVLEGDFWPESVHVLTVQSSGPRVRIEADARVLNDAPTAQEQQLVPVRDVPVQALLRGQPMPAGAH